MRNLSVDINTYTLHDRFFYFDNDKDNHAENDGVDPVAKSKLLRLEDIIHERQISNAQLQDNQQGGDNKHRLIGKEALFESGILNTPTIEQVE